MCALAGLLVRRTRALNNARRKSLELLVLRMQRLEITAGVGRNGDLGEHDLRVAYGRIEVEDIAEARRIDAAAAGEAGIFQNGELKLDLGDSLIVNRLGQDSGGGSWKAEADRPQSSALPISSMVACALAENPVGDPHRRSAAAGVEGIERGEIGWVGAFA